MKKLQGKGFFIWKIPDCENGSPGAIATVAYQSGLTHVLIKVANGLYAYNYDYERRVDYVPEVISALRARGIQVWGWHYVYGNNPAGEARIAIRRVRELGLDGYVIDAEGEYKAPGRRTAARTFMHQLRMNLPDTPLALSSFRYPSYHPQLPWREFLEKCDLNMPQVYWMQANNPGTQLRRSLQEFQSMSPYRPVFPTGAAFREHGWQPTPGEVTEFLETARSLGLDGVNFWSWDYTRRYLPELWQLIADFNWEAKPPVADITLQYIEALNARQPDRLLELYTPTAVHINSSRTIKGQAALRTWFYTLLNTILPNSKFHLVDFTDSGNTRHLTWTATSDAGSVFDGSDTFGLLNGKIAYQYSQFNVKKVL